MSICERCGAAFSCAMVDGANDVPCWCTELPPAVALPDAPGAGCWCPACLKKHIALAAGPSDRSGPEAAAKDGDDV